ncbi:MAG: P-II family nitrogen regulator [Fusobacteriota bacterium]
MKEVMAIIRRNMINQTKNALAIAGIDSMTARKVQGRGKKKVDFEVIKDVINQDSDLSKPMIENVQEAHKLISKRLLTVIVDDEEVKTVVDTLININKTGNPGDGKIFILPVEDAVRVRTGESGEEAV